MAELKLESRTIDRVASSEQQPELDDFIQRENSNTGVHQNCYWRDATGWFSYDLEDAKVETKKITYYGKDADREFSIYINGQVLVEENFQGTKGDQFFFKVYKLPANFQPNAQGIITKRFKAQLGSRTAGIYDIRLLKN